MLKRLKCCWYGHDYDKEKYSNDLFKFYDIQAARVILEGKTPEEITYYFEKECPLPYCKRCHEKVL